MSQQDEKRLDTCKCGHIKAHHIQIDYKTGCYAEGEYQCPCDSFRKTSEFWQEPAVEDGQTEQE